MIDSGANSSSNNESMDNSIQALKMYWEASMPVGESIKIEPSLALDIFKNNGFGSYNLNVRKRFDDLEISATAAKDAEA